MRKPATLFLTAAITWMITDGYADGVSAASIRHQTNQEQLNFKADREMRGAELTVYTATGECILSQRLKRRKLSVDFSEARFGEYIIRITSNDIVLHEYRYMKK